jgi:rhodanese-related sulfurtransferase
MVKQISRDVLVEMMKSGKKFKLVDALSSESYASEHIKGAISIPLAEIEEKAKDLLDKNELIVTYCGSFECQASTHAAEKLIAMGYKNVLDYKGGLKDYKEGNLELEGGLLKEECFDKQCCC